MAPRSTLAWYLAHGMKLVQVSGTGHNSRENGRLPRAVGPHQDRQWLEGQRRIAQHPEVLKPDLREHRPRPRSSLTV